MINVVKDRNDDFTPDKRLLVTETEFARVLMAVRRENNTLSAVIRQAWDSGNLRTITRHSPMTATEAHISILAHITKEELDNCLSDTQLFNGFANRFLWVCAKRSKPLPHGGNVDWDSLSGLQTKLRGAATFAKKRR